ncbi:DUF1365 domain-containing protein [Nocardiopsis dassonvillei]|uniref:DUF1365 domain-containing protein n=1 Tax=Nocardiopsis dassonvillei TaxID=2014 RepID=UPI0020A4FA5F|nr:DUF1365 domain-containing protein [Nocardiopsis dassonvillei]MCP3017121.1 DUF1365 domain-containing protein [Nocardiopsis dassonvillei]
MTPSQAPALYEATVRHVRSEPVRNAFAYGTYYWLVDLDDPPRPRWPLNVLAGFRAKDHAVDGDRAPAVTHASAESGAPTATRAPNDTGAARRDRADGWARELRADIDALLAAHGVDLDGGRVLMLAHARVLGHVFNPLTVYWCHHRDGRLSRVVAEVHNTYGQRHRYVLDVDARGRAEADKAMYVSPFNAVDGRYRLSLPEPGERLALTVALHRDGRPPLTASVHGRRRPATTASLLLRALRHPLAPLVGTLRIRRQGIGLYLRGLPVQPRGHTHTPATERKTRTRP